MGEMISKVRQERLSSFEGLMLTDRTYNLAIGLTLLAGILLDLMISYFLGDAIARWSIAPVIIIYLADSFGCTMVIYRSAKPVVSFLGFMGLAFAMGILLTYLLTAYDLGSIQLAFTLTGAVFLVMVALATVFPAFFLSIGKCLGITLLVTIVIEVLATFLFPGVLAITDYVVVLIFCGYVGFDWARAQQYPKTLDNAIDCAADIYVDIVNLFIRILSIISKSKKD